MNYIHLREYHKNTRRFEHPLLQGCPALNEEDLNALAEDVMDGVKPDYLIDALRGCVSMLVGRYLGNFADSERFLDDMVSEGFTAVTRLCQNLPVELVKEKGILKVASSRAQSEIEAMLNSMQSLSAPGRNKQFQLIKEDDGAPIYLKADTNAYSEAVQPQEGGDELKRDILDAFAQISPEDSLDVFLMDPLNWGRGHQELADLWGTSAQTVFRRRRRLYQKYLELTR